MQPGAHSGQRRRSHHRLMLAAPARDQLQSRLLDRSKIQMQYRPLSIQIPSLCSPRGAGISRTVTEPHWPVTLVGTVCTLPILLPQ